MGRLLAGVLFPAFCAAQDGVAHFTVEGSLGARFLGCFDAVRDNDNRRDLPIYSGTGSVSECAKRCTKYKYFGHQATLECWCGDSFGRFGRSNACKCENPIDVGSGANCVYQLQGASFLGCYEDLADGSRDLPHLAGTGTVLECAKSCEGFAYFGHQSYHECWCGNSYGRFGRTKGCKCGDPTDVGAGTNCVYKIHAGDGERAKPGASEQFV